MKLQQAFYGNDGGGYCLLGISAAASDIVETLCGQIGTPGGASEFQPILFSKPMGDLLFMGYCQQGKLDQARRPTLFFHLLFGSTKDCQTSGINAWSLLQKGYFKSEVPKGPIECIELEENLSVPFPAPPPFPWDGSTLAIQSNHSENELICRLLGNHLNDIAWSGFCYRANSYFTLFGLANSVGVPQNVKCCNVNGEKITGPQHRVYSVPQQNLQGAADSADHASKKRNVFVPLFFLSLLANVILVLCLLHGRDNVATLLTVPPSGNPDEFQKLQTENARLKGICEEFEKFNFKCRLEQTKKIKVYLTEGALWEEDTRFLQDLLNLFEKNAKDSQEQ